VTISLPPTKRFIARADEAQGLHDGSITEIRRAMKPQPEPYTPGPNVHPAKHSAAYLDAYCSERKTPENPRGMSEHWCWWTPDNRQGPGWYRSPIGKPGSRVWVAEAYFKFPHPSEVGLKREDIPNTWDWACERGGKITYRAARMAEVENDAMGWLPWTSMRQQDSRTTLEVVSARVEKREAWEWVYSVRRISDEG
jgi:hypothetical protein